MLRAAPKLLCALCTKKRKPILQATVYENGDGDGEESRATSCASRLAQRTRGGLVSMLLESYRDAVLM